MRQKSDRKKLEEGRCLGEGRQYVGFLKANEAKSIGTSCMIWDSIAERTVDVLSMGEKEFFYIMRFRDDVVEIQEQMRMSQNIVEAICREYGFPIPRRILSTDFLVTFKDGTKKAFSIKSSRNEFDRNAEKNRNRQGTYEKILIRQFIELEYWKRHGISFQIVFREELNKTLASNIEQCLSVYDEAYVSGEESMLRYLVAHKIVKLDMGTEKLCFAKLVKGKETEIRRLYEKRRSYEKQ